MSIIKCPLSALPQKNLSTYKKEGKCVSYQDLKWPICSCVAYVSRFYFYNEETFVVRSLTQLSKFTFLKQAWLVVGTNHQNFLWSR